MSDQFTGEIRAFGFNFPPYQWAYCNGQLINVNQNTALFSILSTFYGGNGTTTFALPNLQGNAPMGQGSGQGLTRRTIGEQLGENTTPLTYMEMPSHTHSIDGTAATTPVATPIANSWLTRETGAGANIYSDASPNTTLAPQTYGAFGHGTPHENRQPFLALNFCICLYGIYPVRS